jgi:Uma2 family endonuclease
VLAIVDRRSVVVAGVERIRSRAATQKWTGLEDPNTVARRTQGNCGGKTGETAAYDCDMMLFFGARHEDSVVLGRKIKDNSGMAAVAEKLTFLEFQQKYEHGDRAYEYWYGEAKPKGMATWIHGLLVGIFIQLLNEAGYISGSDVELRVIPEAHPRPDVIATRGDIEDPYPTKAVDVVVEILSKDDSASYVLEKCQAYEAWGFEYIYVVNPESRHVFRWTGAALEISATVTSIPVTKIWERLDEVMQRTRQEPRS